MKTCENVEQFQSVAAKDGTLGTLMKNIGAIRVIPDSFSSHVIILNDRCSCIVLKSIAELTIF